MPFTRCTTRNASVLAIIPDPRDGAALKNILSHSNWRVDCVAAPEQAWRLVHERPVSVVLSERRLPGRISWKEVLEEVRCLTVVPALIVADREPDDRLCAEVLTAGAFDVLKKPFQPEEVLRVVGLAVRHTVATQALSQRTARSVQAAAAQV